MAAALVFSAGPAREASMPAGLEVVATGVPRPLQPALHRRTPVVLGHHVAPTGARERHRPPSGLEKSRDGDSGGPLVSGTAPAPPRGWPRRLARPPPLFPRAWGGRAGGAMLPRLVSVAPIGDGLIVLSSGGTLYRLVNDALTPLATLPRGQYLRANLVGAPDGGVLMNGGFGVPMLFRISADGGVATL